MQKKTYLVEDVRITILKSNPPILHIMSWGYVPSSGWKDPKLIPYVYIQPPPDGMWEFDFVAEAPTGIVLTALFPVAAEYEWKGDLSRVKGFRVHASSNAKERLITDAEQFAFAVISGGGDPFPVPIERPARALEITWAK